MKRGISPLIATVLIISFTILLGVMILNWQDIFTKGLLTRTEESAKKELLCSSIDLEILNACYTPIADKDDSNKKNLTLTIENKKDIDLNNGKMEFLLKSPNGQTKTPDFSLEGIGSFESKKFYTIFSLENLESVQIVPIVKINDKSFICKPLEEYKKIQECK